LAPRRGSAARKTSTATAQSVSAIFVDIADLQNQSATHESQQIQQWNPQNDT
jgi:hypothetical protein